MKNPREVARSQYVIAHWGEPGDAPDRTLECADPDEKHYVVLGELTSCTYETIKRGDDEPTWYEHEFDPPRPILCYSPRTKRLLIAGGSYTVNRRGIVG